MLSEIKPRKYAARIRTRCVGTLTETRFEETNLAETRVKGGRSTTLSLKVKADLMRFEISKRCRQKRTES